MRQKEGEFRNPSGCAIAAVISRSGERMSGEKIIESMKPMHERSNGLGGGFAGYGIYPEYKELFALHLFYDSLKAREECEAYIRTALELVKGRPFPPAPSPPLRMSP